MTNDSERKPLPFEPMRKRKKSVPASAAVEKKAGITPAPKSTAKQSTEVSTPLRGYRQADASIPEVVSNRMLRRMMYFSGIPVSLGVLIFFASYVVITQQIADLPNVVVLLLTLACFGLSVVGLSYGALSASWDESSLGSLLGWEQFQVNVGRLVGSWRAARENRRKGSEG
jgi:hypothetical protein